MPPLTPTENPLEGAHQGKKNWKKIFLVVAVLLIIGIGYFAYSVWKMGKYIEEGSDKPYKYATTTETSEWKTYRNESRDFIFKYPPYLTEREIYTHNIIACFEKEQYDLGKDGGICVSDNTFRNVSSTPTSVIMDDPNFDSKVKPGEKVSGGSYMISSSDANLLKEIVSTFKFITTAPATGKSGIKGNVLLGPTCPVMREPPDPQCADKPYKTNLVLTTADQAKVLKQFSSDENGNFTVSIEPGTYSIRSAASANILPSCYTGNVKVNKDSYTEITVSCDTGIR